MEYLADHVQMTLQDNSRQVLAALGAGLLDDDVVELVGGVPQAALFTELDNVLSNSFLVLGAVGDGSDILKILHCISRLKTFQNIFHGVIPHFVNVWRKNFLSYILKQKSAFVKGFAKIFV